MPRTWLLAALLALIAADMQTEAKVSKGTVSSTNGFAFGGKFCFQNLPNWQPVGVVEASLVLPVYTAPSSNTTFNITDLQIVLYDDQEESWPQFLKHYDNDWSCQDMLAHRKFAVSFPPCHERWRKPELRQVRTIGDQCWSLSPDGRSWTINVVIDSINQQARPRFWFLTFMKCDGSGFANLDFHLHWTQTQQSAWSHEYGSEATGLNSLYLFFFFVVALLLIVHAYGTYQLSQQLQYVHPLVRLFCVLLLVQFLSIFALLVHYGTYARDGIGVGALQKLGSVLDIVARSLFILLLLLLAKGWTISNERLTHRWAIVTLVASYLALCVAILLWSYSAADPMESQPSDTVEALTILLGLVWLALGVFFAVQIFAVSWRREMNPAKRRMYLKIGLIFTPWMVLPPIASLLGFAVDPWARDRVVIGFTLSATVVSNMVMVFLFWPSRAEKTFFSIAVPDVGESGINAYEAL